MSKKSLQKAVDSPIALFEREIGGREHIIESLSIDSSAEIRTFVALASDQDYADLSLSELAKQAHLDLPDLLRAYRNATLARAQILAVKEIAKHLPEIAADVMMRALPVEATCPLCRGMKTQPGKFDQRKEYCKACDGKGTVMKPPPVQRQRLALELAELVKAPKGGMTLLQQFNIPAGQNTNAPTPPAQPGALERMQQVVTDLLFNRPVPIDITPEPEPEPTEPLP